MLDVVQMGNDETGDNQSLSLISWPARLGERTQSRHTTHSVGLDVARYISNQISISCPFFRFAMDVVGEGMMGN